MKRFIRNRVTRSYLAGDGQWTVEPHQALHFSNCMQVYEAVRHFQLSDVEEVLQTGEWPSERFDVVLPLNGFDH